MGPPSFDSVSDGGFRPIANVLCKNYATPMTRALISADNSLLRNMAGIVIAVVAIPITIVVKLVVMPFEKPIHREADEVVRVLRDFHSGTGDDYDWDDFVNVPIADARLESIRERARALKLPADTTGLNDLRLLLEEAEAIARADCLSHPKRDIRYQ